jgi:hypothetical protein
MEGHDGTRLSERPHPGFVEFPIVKCHDALDQVPRLDAWRDA